MAAQKFVYFAYGSNMLTERLRERCPSAILKGVAELKGYALRWHKRSRDGSGKCDIVQTPEGVVYGVLYDIAVSEKGALNRAEGAGNGYQETEVSVSISGTQRRATTYQATNIDPALRPYCWYRAQVIAGAREHGLPPEYIVQIETVDCTNDPNLDRCKKEMSLIEKAVA